MFVLGRLCYVICLLVLVWFLLILLVCCAVCLTCGLSWLMICWGWCDCLVWGGLNLVICLLWVLWLLVVVCYGYGVVIVYWFD